MLHRKRNSSSLVSHPSQVARPLRNRPPNLLLDPPQGALPAPCRSSLGGAAAGKRGPRLGKMLKRKREHDCTTGCTETNKPKDCTTGSTRHGDLIDTFEEQFGYLYDSGQGVWSKLSKEVASKLSTSVFAIASFKGGDKMVCACSGIVIRCKPDITTLLTSASLVRSFHDESKVDDNLTIRVRNPYYQFVDAWLEQCDLHYNIAVVNIQSCTFHSPARLSHQVQLESGSKVVAIGCLFNSRKLMATSGIVMDELNKFAHGEFMISTCKVSKAGTGGPLIDFNGNFVGMNFCDAEHTSFLPRNIILKCLECFGISRGRNKRGGGCSSGIMVRSRNVDENDSADSGFFPQELVHVIHDDLRSRGYPLPKKFAGGMTLINCFEEKFPNLDGSSRDVLNDLSEEVALNLSCSVVSLASFNGKARLFACTGILIECNQCTSVLTSASLVRSSGDENKIDDNLSVGVANHSLVLLLVHLGYCLGLTLPLQIEVRLPNKQCVVGKLQHYSLHYNIAVVNIMASPSSDIHAANLYHQVQFESGCKVVAVGRIFTTGKLTATTGTMTDKPSKLDCTKLLISTCNIRKGGIGGPLVDFNGYFIGMNFYDEEETPFLPRNIILECLRHFETKGTIAADSTVNCNSNRWPVPKPYWYYPDVYGDLDCLELQPPMLL